jgi:ribosome-associated protein
VKRAKNETKGKTKAKGKMSTASKGRPALKASGGARKAAAKPAAAKPARPGKDKGPKGLGPLLPVEPRAEDPRIKALALRAVDAALEKKCLEPVLLDVRALASYCDYILIVSGRSDRQVVAIADGVLDALGREGKRAMGSEGLRDGQWSLLDFGDVIVHVFYHPVREFYDLEGLWSDAPRVPLTIPPEARAQVEDSYAP